MLFASFLVDIGVILGTCWHHLLDFCTKKTILGNVLANGAFPVVLLAPGRRVWVPLKESSTSHRPGPGGRGGATRHARRAKGTVVDIYIYIYKGLGSGGPQGSSCHRSDTVNLSPPCSAGSLGQACSTDHVDLQVPRVHGSPQRQVTSPSSSLLGQASSSSLTLRAQVGSRPHRRAPRHHTTTSL